MLDQDKMCHSIEILMEYISITLLSGRYDFVVEGYEETYRIKLINDNLSITEDLDDYSTSIVRFDSSKSSINSKGYEKYLIKKLDNSLAEYMRINMVLNQITKLQYKQKYCLINRLILQKSISEICKKINISPSTYYRILHAAKLNLALLLPEVYAIKGVKK